MVKEKKPIPLLKWDFTDKKQGFRVLLAGIVVALVLGVLATKYNWVATWAYWTLALGVVIGILNIFHKEGVLFLIAGLTITFMLNVLAGLTLFPVWVITLLDAVIYLLAPATLVVGLKVLYALAVK